MLKIAGEIAGIGGICLVVLLVLFREVIRKNMFPKLTKKQAYRLMVTIIISVGIIALSGIIAWSYALQKSALESSTKNIGKTAESIPHATVTTDESKKVLKKLTPGSMEKLDHKKKENNTKENQKIFDIVLIVPSFMSDAKVLVDGKAAKIIKRTPTTITVRIKSQEEALHQFMVKKGDRSCAKEICLTGNTQKLTLCH